MQTGKYLGLVFVAVAVFSAALLCACKGTRHDFMLKAYFTDGNGLRSGAPVRMAGVEVGKVKSVLVRPELRAAPVEVELSILPLYEMKIPQDAVVSLRTAGILGETYPEIEISGASGLPAKTNEVLKAQTVENLSTDQALKLLRCFTSKRPASPRK